MDVPSPIPTEALLAEASLVRRLAQALVRRRDLAHDVAQDVMLVALRQAQPPGHLRGWLAAVTRRLAGKALQAQRTRAVAEAEAAPPPADDAEARTAERLHLHRRLTDAVAALPEPYRTTVTLRFLDELPPRAIAQRLGTSSEVVRKRLQRGLEMLRERLDGEFGDRGRWARAFAALGLLEAGSPWLLLTVLAMNKLALAAAATLVVGVWIFWPDGAPPPVAPVVAATGDAVAAASDVEVDDGLARHVAPIDRDRAETPPPRPDCAVQLVDEVGRPVVDATVFGWRDGDVDAVHRVTDRDGRCAFGAWHGAGGLLVVADGRFLHHEALPELAGDHDVVLPSGAAIGGTLLVDGQPGAGWRMALVSVDVPDAVPDRLRRRYAWRGCAAVCDAFGRFEFVGVPSGWEGTMSLPQPLWLLDGPVPDDPRLARVVAGQRHLDLRATQLPTLRGRAVWSDTGEAVAWPTGSAIATFDDGDNSPMFGFGGERDGTFAVGFDSGSSSQRARWLDPTQRPVVTRVKLELSDQSGAAETRIEVDAAQFASGEELVVRLDRVPITHFRCVDEDGRPIADARVQARNTSAPTDADGRGTFEGAIADVELVGSPRHRIGPVVPCATAAGTADDPVVFVLERANIVHVRIDGRVDPDRRMVLRSGVLPFAGRRPVRELDRLFLSIDGNGGWRNKRADDGSESPCDYYLYLPLPDDGHMVLQSLEPGVQCDLAILDDLGRDRESVTFTAPEFGAVEAVSMHAPSVSSRFEGQVVDELGHALARVEVRLQMVDGERVVETPMGTSAAAHARTDAAGRFHFRDAGDLAQLVLTLRANGFVERRITSLASGGVHVLQRGHVVEVRVVDGSGVAIDVGVSRKDWRQPARKEQLRAGVWRFSDLAPGRETFSCRVGADEFTIEHDTSQPEATLRVPRPAKLRVEVPGGWPQLTDARHAAIVVARCVDGGHATYRLWRPERGEFEALLPGTWHLELFEWSRPDRSLPAVETSLGLSAEVTLRAGEETTATLR